MQLFWGQKLNDTTVAVDVEDVTHMVKSLRNQIGDEVHCIDGSGWLYRCKVTQITKKEVIVTVIDGVPPARTSTSPLHIGIALTKNVDRMEWFVEKAVEIGIDAISFINCERSVRLNMRMDRITRIVRSAMKQSMNITLPVLKSEVPFREVIKSGRSGSNAMIATCAGEDRKPLMSVLDPVNPNLILIGPEGDFSPAELLLAREAGFIGVTIGESRLRTETAGVVACTLARIGQY